MHAVALGEPGAVRTQFDGDRAQEVDEFHLRSLVGHGALPSVPGAIVPLASAIASLDKYLVGRDTTGQAGIRGANETGGTAHERSRSV
ncbi:hypothetical protein RGQ21_55540 [Kitasatospora aureofaciens]|nr:hypothetical protein RGQ21_55540 [Kitasatospora aureofaciens]